MRMPGMSGAELLQLVRERHPETVRLVLSGHSEFEADARRGALSPTSSSPSRAGPDELQSVIERACELRRC